LLVGLTTQIAVLGLYVLGIVTRHAAPFFLAGRFLHGAGSGCVFISAQALALHAGGASERGRSAGTVRAAMVLGVPIGLAAGGLLSEAAGDAAAFAIAAGGILAALGAAYVRVPDLRAPAGARRRSLAETILAMRDRRLLAIGVLNFVLNFAVGGMILTTLALLVHQRGISLLSRNEQGTAGILMASMLVIDAAATPLAGRIGDRRKAHARVGALAMVSLVIGLTIVGLSSRGAAMAVGLAFVGVGAAGLGPSLLVLMGAIVPADRRGAGVGMLQLCGDLGGMLGPLVGTALFAGNTRVPYLGTAAFVACAIPLSLWLARVERGAEPLREDRDGDPNASA
jgi:MFS family permease